MNRRRLLTSTFAGFVGALSGCSDILPAQSSEQKKQKLSKVEVLNWDTQPREVGVLIRKNNDIVFWSTVSLEAASEESLSNYTIPPTEYSSGYASEWELSFRLLPRTSSVTYQLNPGRGNDPCKGIIAMIRGGEVDITRSEGPKEC